VASLGLSFTSEVITFDQNWHHLCSTSAGKNDLPSGTQIRKIGLILPEICTKMPKNLSEKFGVKIARLADAFSEFFKLKASPVEGQLLKQKEK